MAAQPTNLFRPATFLWLLRAAWVALAVLGTLALDAPVARIAWWAAVAAVTLALVVPSAVGLTVTRMVAPGTVVAMAAAWASGASAGFAATALVVALAVTLLALSGEVGEAMVQGAAYGQEQRFPLRVPAPVLVPMVLSWIVWCGALVGGVWLLADRRWVAGAVLTAAGVLLSWLLASRFHRLSRRWLVVVPAGVVVHDHLVLGETLMVQRTNVAVARLALAGTEAADLTGPAAGHAVEVAVKEMVLAVFPSTKEQPKGRAIHVQSFLVGPTRPGRALQAMADSRLPVG